ncbi:protein of unknown function [Modestobacter italicus]|uniref:Uncharacterized protein n=1 Tax=Modestobacter italicus (strain DSM 44449 / CECT 9708 / BC 501) TaxID=2732864 RepID=I4F4Y5_MODI5|nr:protein of unknown function [Modestobacter marinus]
MDAGARLVDEGARLVGVLVALGVLELRGASSPGSSGVVDGAVVASSSSGSVGVALVRGGRVIVAVGAELAGAEVVAGAVGAGVGAGAGSLGT